MTSDSRFLDPVVVIGVLLSIALAVAVSVATTISAQVGIVVGLIGTTIALQIDTMVRLAKRSEREDQKSRLLASIVSSPGLSDTFTGIVDAVTSINTAQRHPAFERLAKERLDECLDDLLALQSGQVVLSAGNATLMTEQVQVAKRSIHATTFTAVDLEWWNSSAGRTYLQSNAQAVRRNVTVERIFVYDDWNDDVEQLAQRQVDSGVTVYRVHRLQVPKELRRNLAIYDRGFLVEDVTNAEGDVTGFLHAADYVRVNRAYDIFCRLQAIATELDAGQH